MTVYVGIDPGKSGAMAILYPNGSIETIPFNMVNYVDAIRGLADHPVKCCLEKVGAMPGQGGRPGAKGGFDPVKENYRGRIKWLI